MSLTEALTKLRADRSVHACWRVVYESLWPFVYAKSYRCCVGSRTDPADVAQESFLRFLRHGNLLHLHDANDLKRYLTVVVHHTMARTSVKGTRDAVGIDAPQAESLTSPHGEVEAALLREEIERCLRGDDLRMFRLLLDGSSVSEVASEFSISYSAAAVRIHRLRVQVRSILENVDPPEPKNRL